MIFLEQLLRQKTDERVTSVFSQNSTCPPQSEQNNHGLWNKIKFVVASQIPYYFFIITAWLVILVSLRERRGYQDSWILEDVFPFVILFCITFIWVVSEESRSDRIALVSASFVIVLHWIPSLKYKWLYGTAVDQVVHLASVQNILATGFPPNDTPYTNIPGMHVLISAVGLINDATVDDLIGYTFPLILGLIPLLIYFLTSQIGIMPSLQKQIIIVTAFAFDPYFELIQGSPFGVFLMVLVLVFFLSRESANIYIQIPLTFGLLGSIVALTLGHGVSSLIFIILLSGVSIALILINHVSHLLVSNSLLSGIKRLFMFSMVAFTSWWMYQALGVFTIFVGQVSSFVSQTEVEKLPIPSRVSELSLSDLFPIFWSLHGNTFILVILSGLGIFILWKQRQTLTSQFQLVLIVFLLLEMNIGAILLAQLIVGFGNIEYLRLLGYAVALSPIFAGASLWILQRKSHNVWLLFLSAILFMSLFQAFPYQPAFPGGDRLSKEIASSEYILYVHTVVTDYQANMLSFIQGHVEPGSSLMSDRITINGAYRFWGTELAKRYDIQYPVYVTDNLDDGEWDFMMLHRAGIAGPYGEQVEVRHKGQILRILQSPEYAVVYSNGESYILVHR